MPCKCAIAQACGQSHRSQPGQTKSQRIDFSCIRRMDCYIPEIRHDTLPYPMLACNIDGIDKVCGLLPRTFFSLVSVFSCCVDQALIGWQDVRHTYDRHNLIFDVPHAGLHRAKRQSKVTKASLSESLNSSSEIPLYKPNEKAEPIFSIVKHYPPAWQRRVQLENQMVGPVFAGSFDSMSSSMPLC